RLIVFLFIFMSKVYFVLDATAYTTFLFNDIPAGTRTGHVAFWVLGIFGLPFDWVLVTSNFWGFSKQEVMCRRVCYYVCTFLILLIPWIVVSVLAFNQSPSPLYYPQVHGDPNHSIEVHASIVVLEPEHAQSHCVTDRLHDMNVTFHTLPTVQSYRHSTVKELYSSVGMNIENEAKMEIHPNLNDIVSTISVMRHEDVVNDVEWVVVMNEYAVPMPSFATSIEILMDTHMENYDMLWLDSRGHNTYVASNHRIVGCCSDAMMYRTSVLEAIIQSLSPDDGTFETLFHKNDNTVPQLDQLLSEHCNSGTFVCGSHPLTQHE
ncbi:MAG: hypothetical protein ACTSUE_18110, partial [Promethearchaeota archaeon]